MAAKFWFWLGRDPFWAHLAAIWGHGLLLSSTGAPGSNRASVALAWVDPPSGPILAPCGGMVSFYLQKGFRVRTFAVTAAPPKRPFWQLWRPPKAFSRGEISAVYSLQEARRSSRLRGFRAQTYDGCVPKLPFWQLWRLPQAFSRRDTSFFSYD